MALSSALRKFVLALHVMSSLGWAGAVAVFVVLDIAALTGPDPQLGRFLWLACKLLPGPCWFRWLLLR